MKTLQLQFQSSFYVTWGLIAGLSFFITLVPALLIPAVLAKLIPLLSLLILLIPYREWRHAVRTIDDDGVTRHDGRRLPWVELQRLQPVHRIHSWGQTGGLNHLDLHFTHGRARILPAVLEPGEEAIRLIQARQRPAASAPASPPAPTPAPSATAPTASDPAPEVTAAAVRAGPARASGCSICDTLGRFHFAMQKHGREEEDTFLPEAVQQLRCIKTLHPGRNRSPELLQCPGCSAFFLYEVGYEYLATGSEDDQALTRLSPAEAAAHLQG